MFLKLALLSLILAAMTGAPSARASVPSCDRPWVFFDLGNTIIDMGDKAKGPKGEENLELRFMPGARKYIDELKARHTHLGVISNVPQTWGKTLASKLIHLKTFIQDHWHGHEKIRWSAFDAGVLLPPTDKQRKPSPYLFEKALERASAAGCPAIYIGENEKEVRAAREAGLHAYQAGKKGRSFYLPEKDLQELLSTQASNH